MQYQELIKGGCGRSATEVFDSATAWGWVTLAAVIAMLAVFVVKATF